MIERKARELKQQPRFSLLNLVPCNYSPAWYKGLKKEFGWSKISESEKKKIAELDDWSVGLTEMHPSALKKATKYIWGYEKDREFLRFWLRRNGWTLKHVANQNTLYTKTRTTKKKLNLRQYFAAK